MPTKLNKPVTRETATVAATFGPDRDRRIVVSLIPGGSSDDLIEFRLLRTKRALRVTVRDLWAILERAAANKAWSERMTKRKTALAEARQRRLEQRATARLAREVKGGAS